jgi:hypothetical protein
VKNRKDGEKRMMRMEEIKKMTDWKKKNKNKNKKENCERRGKEMTVKRTIVHKI